VTGVAKTVSRETKLMAVPPFDERRLDDEALSRSMRTDRDMGGRGAGVHLAVPDVRHHLGAISGGPRSTKKNVAELNGKRGSYRRARTPLRAGIGAVHFVSQGSATRGL
jgi:hypothetical protein